MLSKGHKNKYFREYENSPKISDFMLSHWNWSQSNYSVVKITLRIDSIFLRRRWHRKSEREENLGLYAYIDTVVQSIFELLPLHSIPNQLEIRHIVHIWEDLSPLSWFSLLDIPNYSAPRKCFVLNWVKFDSVDTRGHCSQIAEHFVFLHEDENYRVSLICKYAQHYKLSLGIFFLSRLPMPQNVRYRLNTSTSRSVNSSWPKKREKTVKKCS